jgi:hypothetical protein
MIQCSKGVATSVATDSEGPRRVPRRCLGGTSEGSFTSRGHKAVLSSPEPVALLLLLLLKLLPPLLLSMGPPLLVADEVGGGASFAGVTGPLPNPSSSS